MTNEMDLIPRADYLDACNAVREKGGSTSPAIKSAELGPAIRAIAGDGKPPIIQPLTVTENGEYPAPPGVDGYSPVSVNVPSGGGDDTEFDKLVERQPGEILNKTATKVGRAACQNYAGLTKFTGLKVKTLEDSCFRFCNDLSEVSFPVLEYVAQGFRNFGGCAALAKFDAPTTFKAFRGSLCFDGCAALVTVILRSSVLVTLNNKADFQNTPISKGTGYIYVPKALVDQYKTATNWVNFAAQFRAIEDYPDITGG